MSALSCPFTNRAIHLRITPRPSNLGESREILRLLSGFGEIEYYKNLKYDLLTMPNAALVIFRDEKAAIEALKKSPIRFRMGKAPLQGLSDRVSQAEKQVQAEENEKREERPLRRGPTGTPFGLGAPAGARGISTSAINSADSTSPAYQPFFAAEETTPESIAVESKPQPRRRSNSQPPPRPIVQDDAGGRIFQIQTNPSFRKFRDHVNMAHYGGSFAIDSQQFGQEDMKHKVPLLGLSCMDWRAAGIEGRPWHIIRRERDSENAGPTRRKTLGELWEEGREVDKGQESSWKEDASEEEGGGQDRGAWEPAAWGVDGWDPAGYQSSKRLGGRG
ncbi:uncharacterized protein LTR77_004442 [Saxophila tyrrhenica]|uniref:Uncharacterized protein n=1 Tax=Saxophila tyrrhenica TaxID=1690608 RepID=A0AAV9PGZ8_9PEZI|nr:hypothetical protein LTR77_004442 [Saxophila tyrrhenica]